MNPTVHLWQKSRAIARVAAGNLLARWPRAAVATTAVALGVALVAAVTSGYSSTRQTILDWNYSWVGHSQIHLQPVPERKASHGPYEYPFTDPRIPPGLADRVSRATTMVDGQPKPIVKQAISRQKEECRLAAGPTESEKVVYAYGIEPAGEQKVRDAGMRLAEGAMLTRANQALVDENLVRELHIKVGDTVRLTARTPVEREIPPEFNLTVDPAIRQRARDGVDWVRGLGSQLLRGLLPRNSPLLYLIPGPPKRPPLPQPVSFQVAGIIARPRFGAESSVKQFGLVYTVMIGTADMARLFPNQAVGTDSIDLILHDNVDPAIAAEIIRKEVADYRREHAAESARVEVQTAAEKRQQLDKNLELFNLIRRTVSLVALLTAGYIVFTTLGMGMVQRQAELGMLRSVGAGRGQIAVATFAEALPIALVGIALGLAVGLLAVRLIVNYYQAFFTRMVIDLSGLCWAAGGGLIAVLAAVAIPAWMASRVSPLAASRPMTRRIPIRTDIILALVGTALIGLALVLRTDLLGWSPRQQAAVYLTVGVPLLFLGFFLAAPLVVGILATGLKYVAAAAFWIRPRLLNDQVQTARWRTASNVAALMVGLSLLVNLGVHSESVMRGWKLPDRMPPGFVFFLDDRGINPDQLNRVRQFQEIRDPTPLMAFWVRYLPQAPAAGSQRRNSEEAQFLAGSLDRLQDLVQLTFLSIEGGHSNEWAVRQVQAGRGVLVSQEFAARFNIKIGQPIRLYRHDADPLTEIPVVATVESPPLNMAIDFLNLRNFFQSFASESIIGDVALANRLLSPAGQVEKDAGTNDENARARGRESATESDTPPRGVAPSRPRAFASFPAVPEQTRILMFNFNRDKDAPPQKVQLEQISRQLGDMSIPYYAGSLDELREMIVGEFHSVVAILQEIALWATAIASLGVGFSMAANVHSRRRQLAMLRAIGMTRFQLTRTILAEAAIIALLGAFLGIVHGLTLSANAVYFDRVLFGLRPQLTIQFNVLLLAIGFAILCCLVASLIPALRAGRTNILAAMRQL